MANGLRTFRSVNFDLNGLPRLAPPTVLDVQRSRLANALLAQGLNTRNVQVPEQVFGNLAQTLAGALIDRRVGRDVTQRQNAASQALADALGASQRAVPFIDPDDPTGTRVMPGTSRSDVLARALAQNPDLAPMAADVQLGQIARQEDLTARRQLEQEGFGRDVALLRERARLAQEAQPEPERFEPVLDADGNIVGQRSTTTGRVVADPRAPDLLSDEEFAQAVDLARERRPQTNVRVNTAGLGKAPPGFAWKFNPQTGEVERDEDGRPLMVAAAGGPADIEQQEKDKQQAERTQQQQRQGGIVLQDIDRALDLSDQLGTTGFAAQLTQDIGGTPANDLRATLNTIRANVGFDKLQQMRNASPTGGALGQVSERENLLLQSTLGSLEQSQSKAQFQGNLRRLRNVYLDIIHGPGEGPERSGESAAPAVLKAPSEMTDEELMRELGIE